jgi:hypothetical protein
MKPIYVLNQSRLVFILAVVIVSLWAADVFAWRGNYLILDGNGDYAQFLPEGRLDVGVTNSKNFTVEFWVMPTQYGTIISDDAYDISYIYDDSLGHNVIQFRIWFDGEHFGVLKRQVDLLGTGWHHVVCSYDNVLNKAAIGVGWIFYRRY